MKSILLLLVLLGLAAHATAQSQRCATGATKNTGCYQCAGSAADADCEWCQDGYWKSGTKACTVCPDGTGRTMPTAAVQTETSAVCTIKSAPQLKCAIAGSRYMCSSCPTGQYFETASLHGGEVSGYGCSTDCKSLGSRGMRLVPNPETVAADTPKNCISCAENCNKCEFTSTLKRCDGTNPTCAAGYNKQTTKCTECNDGYYLKNNVAEPAAVIPSCAECGANCKKCKDATACDTCYPGWATDSTDKINCLKSVAVSGNIIKAALISILALFIAW